MLFLFNAQHDCHTCGCAPTGTESIRQERLDTQRTRSINEHVSNAGSDHYVLNIMMHALQIAVLLRQTLPRHLTAPKCYIPAKECLKKHQEIAHLLQISGPKKRADAQAKAAKTRARKKAEKQANPARGKGTGAEADADDIEELTTTGS